MTAPFASQQMPAARLLAALPLAVASLLLGAACLADDYGTAERSHWAFQPVRPVEPPRFDDPGDRRWAATPIDAFVLARLKESQLVPSPPAGRAELIRRVTFDLTGLPPTPAEVREFAGDERPDAYERLVDRLLADPRYGEAWGRHWLDVVRYAESEGFEYDNHRPGAWHYRDWVIGAFNADMPYDRFVRLQLAGDEIPAAGVEGKIAAGFHRLGAVRRNAGNAEVAFSRNEVLTERNNIVGTAFLGLTLGCARCHDHMFDAIRQKDYYRMEAFLASAFESDEVLADEEERRRWERETKRIDEELERLEEAIEAAPEEARPQLMEVLAATEARRPLALPTISTVRNVTADRSTIHVLDRGDPDHPKAEVGPQFLGVLLPPGAAELPADQEGLRTRLAGEIVRDDNPLTARVIVNRLWQHHFGRGLVATANDFGTNGASPTHPELLDFLAGELVHSGWRLKPIQRMIVLGSVYRQSSATPQEAIAADPENRRLARFSRRRLEAEELRDAMLCVAGAMNARAGGESVFPRVDPELVGLLYKPSQWKVTADESEQNRRSVYLVAKRNLRIPFLEVFDQPDLQTSCARRESSTHAPQALEMLNGEFAARTADQFASRLLHEAGADAAAQVELAFQLCAGRPPGERERQLSLAFLQQAPLSEFALAMLNCNEFLYVR